MITVKDHLCVFVFNLVHNTRNKWIAGDINVKNILRRSLLNTGMIGLIFGGQVAYGAAALEEIVVTAEKREQSVQDLSLSVTAMTDELLDAQNVTSPEDLNALVPGLTISKSEGFRKIVTIRGLGMESAQNDVANPSVSYHVDGAYIASDLSLNTDFLDVERVEVLRGPQGTIFGQNSTGGSINVISKKPDLEGFSGRADLTLGNYNLTKARAAINVPLNDAMAMRWAMTTIERDGFAENVAIPGYELDLASNVTARGQFLWQPSDNFSAILRAQYFERDGNGSAQRSITETGDIREVNHDFPDTFSFESEILSATFQWDFDAFTIKTIHSYQDEEEDSTRDNDRGPTPANHVPVSSRAPKATTHEINVVSNGEDNVVDWIAGAFLLDSESRVEFDSSVNGDQGFQTSTFHERDSWSVYTQATVHVVDSVRVVTGLRYTDDEQSSAVCNFFCTTPMNITSQADKVTGKLGVEFDFAEDSMVYGTYSRGFKPGGTNLSFGNVVSPSYLEENIDAYEIGSKNRLLNDTLQLNVSAFFYDYENYQFQTSDPVPFSGGVDNIPEAESKGLEVEFNWLLSDSVRIDGNFAYLDTEVTSSFIALDAVAAAELQFALPPADQFDFPVATEARSGALQDITGSTLPKAPELSSSLILSHTAEIDEGRLTSRIHYVYRDEFQYRVYANSALDTVESYDLWNLTFLWEPAQGDWSLEFLVTNLADDDIVNSRFTDNFGINSTSEEFIAPRQFMLRAGIEF